MSSVRLDLNLDEIELLSSTICRDRDRVLDERFGHSGTRLISDREVALVPVHQEILRKIEEALVSSSPPLPSPPSPDLSAGVAVNAEIDALVENHKDEPPEKLLGYVRAVCAGLSTRDLHTAIGVHRTECRVPSCPVLVLMVAMAAERAAAHDPSKHPAGCACDDCEHYRAEHGS